MAKTKFYKIATLAITLSMIAGSTTFASTFNTNKDSTGYKTQIDSLVTAGTITEAQEDAIVNLITTNQDDSVVKTELNGLVTAGTITQVQEYAVANILTSSKKVTAPTKKTTTSSKKVTAPTKKVATPTKKVAIPTKKVAIPTKKVAIPTKKVAAPTKKVTAPTKKVTTPSKEVYNGIKAELDSLVTSGTITQSQETAIFKLTTTGKGSNNISGIKTGLDGLVTAGTITQSQEDSIINLITSSNGGDLTAYNAALAAVIQANYTPESWLTYQTIVAENVEAVTNTQAEVDTATFAITTAQNSLVTAVVESDLTAYNAALAAVIQANYTPESWLIYQTVVAENVETVTNTQAEVAAATLAITTAQDNLVTVTAVVESDLTAYNATLAAVIQANYTPESWLTYQTIVAENVETVANTQAEVDTATFAITSAQDNLA